MTDRLREAQTRYIKAHRAYVNAFDPSDEQLAELEAAAAEYGAAEEEAAPWYTKGERSKTDIATIPLEELRADKQACIDDLRRCLDALDTGSQCLVIISEELKRRQNGERRRTTHTSPLAQLAATRAAIHKFDQKLAHRKEKQE